MKKQVICQMEVFPTRKFSAPEIILGDGSRNLIGQYVNSLSGRNVLLVTDPGVIKAGWAGEVEDSIDSEGIDIVVYDKVSPNPRSSEVMKGAELYEEEGCDLIVTVGGGSPIDCGKAIGAVASINAVFWNLKVWMKLRCLLRL